MLRTHTCGELRATHVGQEVTLCGWVDSYRDHGGGCSSTCAIATARRRSSSRPTPAQELVEQGKTLRSEYVIQVTGKVARRPDGTANPKLATGEIELRVDAARTAQQEPDAPVLARPAGPAERGPAAEVSLSRPAPRPRCSRRCCCGTASSRGCATTSTSIGFIDVETPILGRSTPEGARDYLVPSRVHHGTFYALPQSPQLYKQILMMAGYDRYVQVARCFRDEDLRADRQPEFTQLDLEMSFVDADDVIGMIDGLVARLAKEVLGLDVKLPLPRMTYDEAMERFGHDAPDLRFGLELVDCTDLAAESRLPRVPRARPTVGRQGARHQRQGGGGALLAQDDRRADRVRQARFRRQGPGLVQGRSRTARSASPIAKNFTPELLAQIRRAAEGRAGRLAAVRRRHVGGHLQGAVRPAEAARARS